MSLSYVFIVVNLASLPLTALAGYTESGAGSTAGAYWNVPATAAVYSEQQKNMPTNTTQAVELLRFMTAYKKVVEALVDITPYSALLRSAADTDGYLTFFAFIDTWVGNSTPETKPIMSLDEAGTCKPTTHQVDARGDGGRSGNGWGVDADMIFWPRTGFVDTRPRESITLSSGYYGSYSIGAITTHEGTLSNGGASIELTDGADFTGTLDAEVYPCPGGGKDVERSYHMGEYAKKVRQAKGDNGSIASIVQDIFNQLAGEAVDVLSAGNTNGTNGVEVNFDPAKMGLQAGMPVWYANDDIVVTNGSAPPGYFPGNPIGTIQDVQGGTATIMINGSCVPGNATSWLPRLRMEKGPGIVALARQLADSMARIAQDGQEDVENSLALLARHRGKEGGRRKSKSKTNDPLIFHPFLVGMDENNAYAPLDILGQIDLNFLSKDGNCAPAMLSFLETSEQETEVKKTVQKAKEPLAEPLVFDSGSATATARRMVQKAGASSVVTNPMKDGDKVCVLARRSTGRVFERTFDMPTFVPPPARDAGWATKADVSAVNAEGPPSFGDRALLQFAVTGHGWSGSTEQCGEFCHAIYHINVNGVNAVNVTEWRDDCAKNPVTAQFGTYEISRNGWCPGSVEPGLYIDMTKWLNKGRNKISVDLSVWSSNTKEYEKYTNYGNYIGGGDGSVLYVGATMFVYDAAAVDAIKGQDKAYTAAETALRTGCSVPKALKPPHEVNSAFGSLLQLSGKGVSQPRSNPARATGLQSPTAYSRKAIAEEEAKQRKYERHGRGAKKRVSFLSTKSELNAETGSRYNFEAKFPWYNFNSNEADDSKWLGGAKVVTAFKDAAVQINTREIRVKVKRESLPEEWGHAAMHIRLEAPPGMVMDKWDRMGSLGIVFENKAASTTDANSRVKLRPSTGSKLTKSWTLAKFENL